MKIFLLFFGKLLLKMFVTAVQIVLIISLGLGIIILLTWLFENGYFDFVKECMQIGTTVLCEP